MPQVPPPQSEHDLSLPPLDGEGEEERAPESENEIDEPDDGDPYDDAQGKDEDFTDGVDGLDEASAVGDDEAGVSTEVDDAPVELQSESMLGDDDAPGVAGEDFGLVETSATVRDAGEEGFDTPEPELRVEDLPRLDDGDDNEIGMENPSEMNVGGDLRWDDRAFTRAFVRPIGHVVRIRLHAGVEVTLDGGSVFRSVDGGETFSAADHASEDEEAFIVRGRARALMREGYGVLRAIDDGPLTLVEATSEATAFTLLDDGSLVAAVEGPERARIVRIGVDGVATIVAEEEKTIEALAADSRSGIVWAGGAFGLVAFRL